MMESNLEFDNFNPYNSDIQKKDNKDIQNNINPKNTTNNKKIYIQGLVCTIAAAIFNCFVDRLFNLLPSAAASFLNSGITVISTSTLLSCGMGSAIYLVSHLFLIFLKGENHSTLRREATAVMVHAAVGAVLNMIATLFFAEAQIVIIPTLIAGAAIGACIYAITKVVAKIMNWENVDNQEKIEEENNDDYPSLIEEREDPIIESEEEEEEEEDIINSVIPRITKKEFSNSREKKFRTVISSF